MEDIDHENPWQNPEQEFTEQDYLAQAEIEQYMASMCVKNDSLMYSSEAILFVCSMQELVRRLS